MHIVSTKTICTKCQIMFSGNYETQYFKMSVDFSPIFLALTVNTVLLVDKAHAHDKD